MPELTWQAILLWWSAVLSTVLAAGRLWEFWRDRFQVEVSYSFADLPEVGNEVLIRNLSATPILLTYWELLWLSGVWPLRSVSNCLTPEYDIGDVRINAHSTKILHFVEADYFDWGAKSLDGRSIYIRLYIAGRRPILRKVYG